MGYSKIVKEAESLMKQKCAEKRKAGTLSKVHEESHMSAVAIFGAATARALVEGRGETDDDNTVKDITKIAGYLHDCEREATEKVPHGQASAEFVRGYALENWPEIHSQLDVIYQVIKQHEGSFKDIFDAFGSPLSLFSEQPRNLIPSIVAHSIIAGDKAFEASGYRVLERRSVFVGKERTIKGDLKDIFKYPNEAHISVLGETMIRLYARNPIDAYPDWLKPFAQEWHAIQYQFYKGLLMKAELDEIEAALFFLKKNFPKFDQKLVDLIKEQQHLNGKHFDKEKYPILAAEIEKLNEMNLLELYDLKRASWGIVQAIATAESPEEAIEKYKKGDRIFGVPGYYTKFFNGIIAYREGSDEFVKEIEDKIRAEVEKIVAKK